METPLLAVNDLTLTFRGNATPTVSGVQFAIDSGKTLALVGESGSGKTLIACSISRLLEDKVSAQGQILFEGSDILTYDAEQLRKIRQQGIAYIFQEPSASLNPSLTIGYQLREITKGNKTERVREILSHVGFQDVARIERSYPHELSGGMQQRVMIALALINHPKLLIADEPTTAIDVVLQKQILELIQRLQKEFGFAILLITHDFALLPKLADDVCVLKEGVIVERGKPDEILRSPKHPYTRQLVDSIFTLP